MESDWLWSYHPSRGIVGAYGGDLTGKCIVLGVTGSVAIYRSIDLARLLMRYGATVRVVMTPTAASMVSPEVFAWATGQPVVDRLTGLVEHVTLASICDAVLVAPATLDTMAEVVEYRASTPVSALVQEALGLGKPVLLVPAMHGGMWRRASSLAGKLEEQGVKVLSPLLEGGQAKYPPVELIAWWAEALISRGRDLKGHTVLVTAGPTYEHIDPVRIVTNPSSGLMGLALALEASWRGATVRLVHGPLSACMPRGWQNYLASVDSVVSAEEMLEAVLGRIKDVTMAFYAAAVSDYRPARVSSEKIPSTSGQKLVVELTSTPKIIAEAVNHSPEALHFGFAAETAKSTSELVSKARRKLEDYKLDAVAVNNVLEKGAGFRVETNHVYIATWTGEVFEIPLMHKRLVARRIIDTARKLYARGVRPRS